MLKKRIIVCLDVKDNKVVKGTQFKDLVELGNPAELAAAYAIEGADELVFLDITASEDNRRTRFRWVEDVASRIDIPFTVGGGIRSWNDAELLLKSGADKVSVNTAAIENPELINELADKAGSQSVVVAVDVKKESGGSYIIYTHGGKFPSNKNFFRWLKEAQERGAGEFLITAIHADGTGKGFDLELYIKCSEVCQIPIIASGGAGKTEHFIDLFQKTKLNAALAAGIFHRKEISISVLKEALRRNLINIRK
jgi:cyclase